MARPQLRPRPGDVAAGGAIEECKSSNICVTFAATTGVGWLDVFLLVDAFCNTIRKATVLESNNKKSILTPTESNNLLVTFEVSLFYA